MCRNIKPLFNFDPQATDDEIRDAALQYVRKISGMRAPSQANEEVFETAITAIAATTRHLVDELNTRSPARNREEEKAKARAKWEQRRQRIAVS